MISLDPLRWWEIEQLTALEKQLFPEDSPWTAEMFWGELAVGNRYLVHHAADGSVDGYAGMSVADDEAQVMTIGVTPDAQGQGIGRALLAELIAIAGERRILLEVRTDNDRAIDLYARNGFRRLGVRRRYYEPSGADAYTMERPAGRVA